MFAAVSAHQLHFSLQADHKTHEGANHPDRDAQFRYIARKVRQFQRHGQPAISVDTKKKELVGPFKNAGREWQPRGEPVSERTALEAATVLAHIASEHRFTLYEYFITDKIGHAQDMAAAKTTLADLASFIRHFLTKLDLAQTTVILTSDHGNIEDLSSRNHTLHKVPTIIWGSHRERVADRINSLVDITPTIVDLLTETTN